MKCDYHLASRNTNRISNRSAILFTVGILFVSGIFLTGGSIATVRSAAAGTDAGIGLVLSIRPAVLPADGGTYPSVVLQLENLTTSTDLVAASNISVSLTSSSPQIGTVPNSVILPAGEAFVVVNFTTTTLPGNTTISAVAEGYGLSTLVVTTKVVGGIPDALNVFLSPSVIPPDEKINSEVIVEAIDANGDPVELGSSLTVTLSSSDAQVGSVPPTVTISAGESFASVTFSPTYTAGTTIVTASAGNYSAGSAVMTTVGPVARKLIVSGPSTLPAEAGQTAVLSIQLQDNTSQTPALAPSPVSVVLTSNNTEVASLSSPIVTIPAGSSYTTVMITSEGGEGTANITASAQGFEKGSAIVVALYPEAPVFPANALSEYFVPNTLLPNNATYSQALEVQLQYYNSTSGSLIPEITENPVTIYARSSNNATMEVSTEYNGNNSVSGVIPSGQSEVGIDVSSTFLPGIAEITAQSPGLGSSTLSLLSFGSAPNNLQLSFAPPVLLSDGRSYSAITVGLIDNSTGQPAQAPVNTVVNLASTTGSVGQVESTVTIPAGQTYARANFDTFAVNGSTFITASASNFTSANGTLTLVTRAATSLGLYSSPSSVMGNGQEYPSIVVQLQDGKGNPEKTDLPVTVQLSVRNASVGMVPDEVVIPAGSTFVEVDLNSSLVAGSTNLTALASGFTSSQTEFSTFLLPMHLTSIETLANLLPGQRTNVSVLASYGGAPIAGANVNWTASSGTLLSVTNTTNVNGTASALYASGVVPGAAFVHIVVAKPGFSTEFANAGLRIINQTSSNPHNKNVFEDKVAFIPVWTLIVVAVAVPAAAFVVIRRRAAGSYSVDDEE